MSATLASLDDFPDSLSPMVIKELRQGLRTRAFTVTLLLLHVFLILTMLLSSMSINTENARWVFDSISSLALCLVLPLRGANAISDEVKHGTLEMLRLTRLSSLQIVFGKWAAVALLCLLVAISLLPYLAARYLLGGVELSLEMTILLVKLLLGLVFAAFLVALSTIRQPWLRSLLIFVPLFSGGFSLLGFFIVSVRSPSSTSFMMSPHGWGVLAVFLAVAWLIFSFLTLGASRISPPAEPLSVLKRSVHLLVMALPFVFWLLSGDDDFLILVFPVLVVLALDAMSESLNHVPTAYVPFFKAGFWGRLFMPILAPGWASGFWVTLLGSGIAALAVLLEGSTQMLPALGFAACSFWMACAILFVLPTRKSEDLLPLLLATLLLIAVGVSFLGGLGWLSSKASGRLPWILAISPPTAWAGMHSFSPGAARTSFLNLSLLLAATWPLALATCSLFSWRSLASVRNRAKEISRLSRE